MSAHLQLRYLRPIPHFFKYYTEISSCGNISYATTGENINAWNPNQDLEEIKFLNRKSHGVSSNSLICIDDLNISKESIETVVCSSDGALFYSINSSSVDLMLPQKETCTALLKQNDLYIISTSKERLFIVDSNQTISELPSYQSGSWLLSGITSYATKFLWDDPRKTISLTKSENGFIHLTPTHIHIWNRNDNSFTLYESIDLSSVLLSIDNNDVSHDVSHLYAVKSGNTIFSLAIIDNEYNLIVIPLNNINSSVLQIQSLNNSITDERLELHSEPLKIYEDEVYIIFQDRVYLYYSASKDSTPNQPFEILSQKIMGSITLPRSILFYTTEGIYEHVYQKEELEKSLFNTLFGEYFNNNSILDENFIKPLLKIPSSRLLSLIKEFCLFTVDTFQKGVSSSKQTILLQSQLTNKSQKIATMIKFIQRLELFNVTISKDILFVLSEYLEKIKFALAIRDLIQQSQDKEAETILRDLFKCIQQKRGGNQVTTSTISSSMNNMSKTSINSMKILNSLLEGSNAIDSFFEHISIIEDIIPSMIEFEEIELSKKSMSNNLSHIYEIILIFSKLFNAIMNESKKERNNFGYLPFYALTSTRLLLNRQFQILEKYYTLLAHSNDNIQTTTGEVLDNILMYTCDIADFILDGYNFQLKLDPKNTQLQSEFKDTALTLISYFAKNSSNITVHDGDVLVSNNKAKNTQYALKLAFQYKIHDSLIQLCRDDSNLLNIYKKKLEKDYEFLKCLFHFYRREGKITEILDDQVFLPFIEKDDEINSLYCITKDAKNYPRSYVKYDSLINVKSLPDKKKYVAMKKLIGYHLDKDPIVENQLLELINIQDSKTIHDRDLPELEKYQQLWREDYGDDFKEPLEMMKSILNNSSLTFEDFILLFHIFTNSSQVRKQSKDSSTKLVLNLWERCFENTVWDSIKFDYINTDMKTISNEIKATLLYRVATHQKVVTYFARDIFEAIIKLKYSEDLSFNVMNEAVNQIERTINISLHLQNSGINKEIDRFLLSHATEKKEQEEKKQIIFESLWNPMSQKEKPKISSSLFYPPKSYTTTSKLTAFPSTTSNLIKKEESTQPTSIKNLLKSIPREPELVIKKEQIERQPSPDPFYQLKKEEYSEKELNREFERLSSPPPRSTADITTMPFPSKKTKQFQLSSPSVERQQELEFSLSDALTENDIELTSNNVIDEYDGSVYSWEEIEKSSFNVSSLLIPMPSTSIYSDEKYDKQQHNFGSKQTPTSLTSATVTSSPARMSSPFRFAEKSTKSKK